MFGLLNRMFGKTNQDADNQKVAAFLQKVGKNAYKLNQIVEQDMLTCACLNQPLKSELNRQILKYLGDEHTALHEALDVSYDYGLKIECIYDPHNTNRYSMNKQYTPLIHKDEFVWVYLNGKWDKFSNSKLIESLPSLFGQFDTKKEAYKEAIDFVKANFKSLR